MPFGSKMRPVYAGIGTAALLAAGGVLPPAAALAAEPTPSADPTPTASSPAPSEQPTTPSDPPPTAPSTPSDPPPSSSQPASPPASPPPVSPPPVSSPPLSPAPVTPAPGPHHPGPALSIKLSLSSHTVAPGGTVMATMSVAAQRAVAHHAVVRLAAPGADVDVHGALGDLGSGVRSVTGLVSVGGAHRAGTVTVTATVSADQAGTVTAIRRVTVDTGGAAGTGSGGGAAGAVPDAGGASFALPPVPMSDATVPGIATPRLPLVAQAPDVAPDRAERPATPIVMRASVSPIGLSRMSLRLAVIEAAWLAGLLTTLSLLIARLRARRRHEAG